MQRELLEKLANGRASAELESYGPDRQLSSRGWFPRLAGYAVHNDDDPPDGYQTRGEAIGAAQRYREQCGVELLKMVDRGTPEPVAKPSCATCRFRDADKCRRYPPQVTVQEFRNNGHDHPLWLPITEFPVVIEEHDWCGEWKPIP